MAVTSGLGMFGSCQSSRNVVVQAKAVANAWTFLAFDSLQCQTGRHAMRCAVARDDVFLATDVAPVHYCRRFRAVPALSS